VLNLSRSAWSRHTVAVLVLLVVAACSSNDEPTAAEAGLTLKTQILELLKQRNADDVTITDPGGRNIPCGEGKAKQTFAATGKDLPERKPDILRSMLLGTLDHIAQYEITNPESVNKPIRVANSTLKTILVLDSPSNGLYAVSGETECLVVS
jgi:hypothetical protein